MADGDIHVWTVSLEAAPALLGEAAAVLADDERARAACYRFASDRAMFMLGRAALRRILAGYLGLSPAEVRLRTGRFGKPGLDPPINADDLRFNASGSGCLSLYAVAWGQEVGIDVEHARPLADLTSLARRVLSARERAVFDSLDPTGRAGFFLDAWTRKEAYLKAIGEGLRREPAEVEFGALLGEDPGSIRDAGDPAAAARRWVTAWRPSLDHTAALVGERPARRVVHHDTRPGASSGDALPGTRRWEVRLPC